MNADSILQCRDVEKIYPTGDQTVTALAGITFSLARGEQCAILGPSGSGKSTLLSLIAGFDTPSSGDVVVMGRSLSTLSDDEVTLLRRKHLGFVFQSYQLLPTLTTLENVLLPLEIAGRVSSHEARELLDRVGMSHRLNHYPWQLSGGEQQRVALARAFVNRPALVLADEPTGSLDEENAQRSLRILDELNVSYGASILFVTHDRELAHRFPRRITLRHGTLAHDERQP